MSDNIKVVVKVRPLISREIEEKLSYQWRVKNNTLYQLDHNGKENGQYFTFDKVYDKDTDTTDVYNDIAKPIVQAATAGINGTIFAYGQTSSGKTYTMTGTETSPGIIPLAVLNLFEIIRNVPDRDFLVRVSYIEIYNETVKDLLTRKDNIKVNETPQGEIKVDSTEKVISSPEEVLEAMREGEQNRQKGATNMNEQSSRSHSIFQITIESREHIEGEDEGGCVNVSQLNLVDLAGSERAGQTGATGIRFKEGTAINKSLSALALVIKQLSEDPNKYANYRDSKLTRILKNSLGGNAKTSIICAVTPAAVEETISTLQFANRAKAIKNKPEVNAVATDATMIQTLTKKMSKLQSQLESKKHIEQDNVNLQKQIAALRRLIVNGFVTRRTDIMQGPKRKLQQPRRVTIHSTLSTTEDEPVVNVAKFCTPSLKYNPLSIPSVSDFVPIQSSNTLASVPEEPIHLITPPPHKTVNFNNEVIELDSDDDSVRDDYEVCSPIHKCYGASKTPPCIHRRNAKMAEKHLKDIVELTEREKIFSPSVVELMEKLEENATTITKLKDEIEVLNRRDKEKDSKVDELQSIIEKNEEEIKVLNSVKIDLQAQCDNFNTKITDWEVSYETLKNKARLREEELLSLLEELKVKEPLDIGKTLSRTFEKDMNFMDMSKDISLVNSDNENSINPDDDTENINTIVKDTQTQLTTKIKIITELETELSAQKEKISSLEKLTQELEQTVSTFKEKLSFIENENDMLKSTIDTLNVTINNQKENLESANNDIESYNRVIQELQNKLTDKDSLPKINIDDSDLEIMISNEQQFIANNENMVNIIQSFKNALDKRNKQIAELKDAVETSKVQTHDNSDLLIQLETKTEHINNLNLELDNLKKQVNENIAMIAKLGNEKKDLKIIEQELAGKLTDIQTKNTELESKNTENMLSIQHLNKENNRLTLELSEKNEQATKEIENLTNKIENMVEIANQKDALLKSLNEEKVTSDENLLLAKTAIIKLQAILCTLSGNIQEVPEIIDNFVGILNCLSEGLNSLEVVASNIVTERGESNKINTDLASQIEELEAKHRSSIVTLEQQIEDLRKIEIELNQEKEDLTETISKLNIDLKDLQNELALQTENHSTVASLQDQIEELSKVDIAHKLEKEALTETINKLNLGLLELKNELELKTEAHSTIPKLKEQIENLSKAAIDHKQEKDALNDTINKLNHDLQELQNKLDTDTSLESKLNEVMELRNLEIAVNKRKQSEYEDTILEKDNTISDLNTRLEEVEVMLKENISQIGALNEQLNNSQKEKHELLTNIFDKIAHITDNSNKENLIGDSSTLYEEIILALDTIVNHITFINMKNAEDDDSKVSEILVEAKKEIAELAQKNLTLLDHLQDIENKHSELLLEVRKHEDDKQSLHNNLTSSEELLKDLHSELNLKASELSSMEEKLKEWKQQFNNFDVAMKQEMDKLKDENENLQSRIQDLESESKLSVAVREHVCDVTSNIDTNSPPSLLTICCNKIVDYMEPKENDSKSTVNSSFEVENQSEVSCYNCGQLSFELEAAKEENSRVFELLAETERMNKELLQEQELVRGELQLLVKPAQELQKKIVNHKTNLSILTATTYAENKSLKSQVKVLQHHHKRFHNVCQRDIPDFKKQLSSLMTLLKGDPTICDQQNLSFKRYSLPDVLDSSTAPHNFKNESTLDGDLLMLDTNITVTTADNTLTHDQTCLDMTQYYTEASCQTNYFNQITEHNQNQIEIIASHGNEDLCEKINILNKENTKLRALVEQYSDLNKSAIDSQNSHIENGNHELGIANDILKNDEDSEHQCACCKELNTLKELQEQLNEELKSTVQQLNNSKSQNAELKQKYDNLVLETPSTNALVKKLNIFEKEHSNQQQEINKLKNSLNQKNQEIKSLQIENDTLSTQVMENISEADDLNKNLERLKEENNQLIFKCKQLEQSTKEFIDKAKGGIVCAQCAIKDELIQTMQTKLIKPRAQLNRSLSDSDTSSRYNKICTLQNELHAGKEDCKELTEDVVTIKNHLERSNISMDLDESMEDCNIYSFNKVDSPQANKCKMPDIPEEEPVLDIYALDRLDCLNYYIEQTGAHKDNLNRDMKIIEVMKMLYLHLTTKHGNEVENLTNRLKDLVEAKDLLRKQYCDLEEKHSLARSELEDNNKRYASVANVLLQIKTNMNNMNEELNKETDISKQVNIFKENLSLLDNEFSFKSVNSFESLINNIVNKHQTDLADIIEKYSQLQEHMETLTSELTSVNANLVDMKSQLTARENEYNLLKAQKERVHEISNAVTLDIVKREKELKDTIDKGYQTLIELSIVKPENVDSNLPLNTNIKVLFELLVTQNKNGHRDKENEKEVLQNVDNLKSLLEEKQKEMEMLKSRNEKLQEINNCVTQDLIDKVNKLEAANNLHEDLNKVYNTKVEENNANLILVEKLSQQVDILNVNIGEKEKTIERLEKEFAAQSQNSTEVAKISELLRTVETLQDENNNLKSFNEAINKEKEYYAEECRKSCETIKNNRAELDKMTSDILVLKESVKESSTVIENLRSEAKSLLQQNKELKEQLEEKRKECSRLETNIKTHEKTAQIQTKMIMRIEKQKTDAETILTETKQQLDELTQRYELLQKDSESSKLELEQLKQNKEELEARILDLEGTLEGYKSRRTSMDIMNESSRRRRQSLYDSRRIHSEDRQECPDQNSVEAVFNSRPKPDDLFMDCEEFESGRSTPIRFSKGRDSHSLSKTDQDEEPVSRPSSVLETRRRRQTIHDAHRGDLSHTPSPYGGNDSTVSQLRERLASCQQELDDLKEKYRELDEECETCSEYLKERDEQCTRLKKEKISLQSTIEELKEKLQSCNPNMSQMNAAKPKVAHAAVNTDEDWTNLHSVVVDRMSYDAEVEKNKKLTKTIEELRFKKQDLKNTLAKMQKCLEKNTGSRELEATKHELQSCKLELSQLKERYKELDEECETCAQYLREKEEQCRRLKEAKTALEKKLHELQSTESPMPRTARKKRQTLHDQNRSSTVDVSDAATNTEEFLNLQVERDSGSRNVVNEKHAQEVKHLKLAVERLMHQKSMLEQQVSAMTPSLPAMYVATGSAIVQNQQITDVMKENQKLKKINAKLITICKKRGKESNRENEDPADLG